MLFGMKHSETDALAFDPIDDEELALWSLDDVLDLTSETETSIDHEIIDPTWSFEESSARPHAAFD